MSIVLKNALLADSKREHKADLMINEDSGIIEKIGDNLSGDKVIDCSDRVIMPSFIDLHAHFRDPGLTHKETVETGSLAAVHGGYTFVNLMPNTNPVCSTMDIVRYIREKAEKAGLCDVHQTVSITGGFDGETISHLDALDGSVKWLTDDGFGVNGTAAILAAMRKAKELGIGLMLHEEDAALSKTDMYLAEELMTFRDVELAVLTGCRTHFSHVSTIKAMEYIISGKKRSADITCEVTPHHLALNDSDPGKVNPPLRAEEHRKFLIECVKNGHVDAIATDHAPHTAEEKEQGANGFTGLDLSFSTVYTTLVKEGGLALSDISRLLSYNPARIMGLPDALLEEGLPANIVLIDTGRAFIVSESDILSKSKNSPMLLSKKKLWGKVLLTIKGGRAVYEQEHDY